MPTLKLVVERPTETDETRVDLAPMRPWFESIEPLRTLDVLGASALLRDLSFALAELWCGRSLRAVVPTEAASPQSGIRARKGAVWEIGIERDADDVLISLFKQGVEPQVAQTERRLALSAARRALLDAIARCPADDRGLAIAREALLGAYDGAASALRLASRRAAVIDNSRRCKLRLTAETELRTHPSRSERASQPSEVSRADLHALLCRGRVSLAVGRSARAVDDVHVFLLAEQLAVLAAHALDARRDRQSLVRKAQVGALVCGVQVDGRGRALLLLETSAGAWRLPAVSCNELARAVVSFGRRLCKHIVDADRSQRDNLRLAGFRRQLRDLSERTRQSAAQPPKLNDTPESYRAYAASEAPLGDGEPPTLAPEARAPSKLRFSQSWRADVPGIDLRSMFLVGDRLVVGSARELACIERGTGHLVWSRRTPRAVSVMTPVGIARLGADGRLCLHDDADGEPMFELQLGPCVGASTSGAVVNAPGLPHMLLVAEGPRHLVAVDLDSSEVRWRRAVRRARHGARAPLRLRRAGKLMLVSTGEATLHALDLLTGEIVWRHVGKRRYGAMISSHNLLFAFASEIHGRRSAASVEALDPWTGERVWQRPLPRPVALSGTPIVAQGRLLLTTRDDDERAVRTGVLALDADSGEVCFDLKGGLCDGLAGHLAVDDLLLANSDGGELVAVGIHDGEVRYRHVFAGWSARFHPADRPRSVQPILRSGALFVPQSEVYVVRPNDGTVIGRVPSDLIPDALRVDERCGVYVAEASGYLTAYHALPSLTLVRRC